MLLAFDLDNTLVTVDHRLPPEVERAVQRAREAGHLVTVLTGRPEFTARPFVDRLLLDPAPFSVNHGATVFGADGVKVRELRLAQEHVRTILSEAYAPAGVPFSCIDGDALYVDDPGDPRWSWAHTENRRVLAFDVRGAGPVDKIVFGANGHSDALQERLRRELPVDTYLWGDGFLEVTARDADKGGALALIAGMLGIDRAETVAFGDGLNDVTMLRWAGHGVSVGPHAPAEVRAAAGEHIASPEELGIVGWLETNVR